MSKRTVDFDAVALAITPGQLAAILDVKLLGRKACRCPFHTDSSPSANIYEEDDGRTVFKCFQCNTTLSAVDFAARVWDMGLKKAGVRLADYIGVDTARLSGWVKRGKRGRPPRKTGPGRVPAELHQDARLGLNEIALYTILTSYRDDFPSYDELAEFGRCSKSTIRRAANRLRDAGWVPRRQRQHGNQYFPLWTPRTKPSKGDQCQHPGASPGVRNEQPEPPEGVHHRGDGSVQQRRDAGTVGGEGGGHEQSNEREQYDGDLHDVEADGHADTHAREDDAPRQDGTAKRLTGEVTALESRCPKCGNPAHPSPKMGGMCGSCWLAGRRAS